MNCMLNIPVGLAAVLAAAGVQARDVKRPNIVFILADDLGYGDVSCLNENGKIHTPNIDRIGKSGVIFTDAHSSSAVCTPTRYGILTGRYNWRSTLKEGVLEGYSKPLIPPDRTTMASMLRQENYHTGCIGKWHLGWDWSYRDNGSDSVDFGKPVMNGPTTRGFDYFFGISASLDMPPYVYVENDRVTSPPDRITEGNNIVYGQPGSDGSMWRRGPTGADFLHRDCLPETVRRSVRFIAENAPSEKPYFLYLALPAPHTPILPSPEFQGSSGLNGYADFVRMMDSEIGKVLDAIDQSGEADNTLIVFASDNGCSPWADFALLREKGHQPGYIFRGAKADLYDGGHRIPCMVRWPLRITKPRFADQTICLIDFMRTFAALAGYRLADNEAEDSFDLLPVLLDAGFRRPVRDALVSHSINGSFTIRKGDWKLLLAAGSGGWSYPRPGEEEKGLPSVQLFNLKEDPGEQKNLRSEHPEIVLELKALLKDYLEKGRSTPGRPQKNDGEYPWKQIIPIFE